MKEIKVHIEIPKGSNIKYEYNRETKEIQVDRILHAPHVYPANYGYIKEALDWDGDELDVLLYSDEKFVPGVSVNARIVGAMKMIDSGETDTKLIAVHADDYRISHIKTLKDIPQKWLKKVETFFTTYKNWKQPGITSVSGFEDEGYALKEYHEGVDLMDQYGKMSKKDFLDKMKIEHPEKYPN